MEPREHSLLTAEKCGRQAFDAGLSLDSCSLTTKPLREAWQIGWHKAKLGEHPVPAPKWSKEGLPTCQTACPLMDLKFGCQFKNAKSLPVSICEPKMVEIVRELKILKANPKGVVLLEKNATLENAVVINCQVNVKECGGNTFAGNMMAGSTIVHEVSHEKAGVVREFAKALQVHACIACTQYEVNEEACVACVKEGHKAFKPIPIGKLDEFEKRFAKK